MTYGDVLMTFRVDHEKEIPASKEETRRGEGTITRRVVAQQISTMLWVRPSRPKEMATPEPRWLIADGGWVFTEMTGGR